MQHPFSVLESEYIDLLRAVKVTRPQAVDAAARYVISHKDRYAAVERETDVPIVMLGALHWRESSGNFSRNLAQGDPLIGPSVHVPRGRPVLQPGMSFPVTWEYAAIDAVKYDHLDDNSQPWSLPYALYKCEMWNGFGPRNHGIHTGYLWAGTNLYSGGKYVADGVWNPNVVDAQIGVVPILLRVADLDKSLALSVPFAATVPTKSAPAPQAPPAGVGGDADHGVVWLQQSLNALGFGPLVVDGNYGRRTREAVRAFQSSRGLEADGYAGPRTMPAIEASLV